MRLLPVQKFSNTVCVCCKSTKICLVPYHKYGLVQRKFWFWYKIISIPDKRIFPIPTTITKIIQLFYYITAGTLTKLGGKISPTKFVWGNIAQLKTRRLCKIINFRTSWYSRITMSQFPEAISEMFFWKNNFKTSNHRKLESYKFSNNRVFGRK